MGRTITTSTRNASVVDFRCDTIEDFLDTISPNGSVMRTFKTEVCPCIFRGVASSKYLLVPTALRNDITGWEGFEFVNGHDDVQGQLLWEQHILRSFFQLADAQGLHIPEDSQTLRHIADRLATYEYVYEILENKQLWPPDEILSLIGIGQHFGLPTRLLDWSRDPFVAAYFAASGAKNRTNNDDELLAVWVMNLSTRAQLISNDGKRRRPIDDVVIVSSPAALNSRLHAQQGLFTLYRPLKINFDQEVHNMPLDDYIQPPLPRCEEDSQLFWLVTLPASHAEQLLDQLVRIGYSPAKLFPGFEGIVRALQEHSHSDVASTSWWNVRGMRHILER